MCTGGGLAQLKRAGWPVLGLGPRLPWFPLSLLLAGWVTITVASSQEVSSMLSPPGCSPRSGHFVPQLRPSPLVAALLWALYAPWTGSFLCSLGEGDLGIPWTGR